MSRSIAKYTPKDISEILEGCDTAQQLTYRHFENFRNTYRDVQGRQEHLYGKMSLRNIGKNLKPIEDALGGAVFTERSDGEVSPSPLGDRLFNDTRGIEASMERLMAKVSQIRETRVLRVGACEATFRTDVFRRIFRKLGAFDDFRIVYVPVAQRDAGSALAQGHCDWYFGFATCKGERYTTDRITDVELKLYQCADSKDSVTSSGGLSLPTKGGERYSEPDGLFDGEMDWVRCFERPKDCTDGCVVRAPKINLENRMWNLLPEQPASSGKVPLLATRLRHHPYGFLHSLPGRLKQSISNATEA